MIHEMALNVNYLYLYLYSGMELSKDWEMQGYYPNSQVDPRSRAGKFPYDPVPNDPVPYDPVPHDPEYILFSI